MSVDGELPEGGTSNPNRRETVKERLKNLLWNSRVVLTSTVVFLGLIPIFLFSAHLRAEGSDTVLRVVACGLVVLMASVLAGALVGFLFGVPTLSTSSDVQGAANLSDAGRTSIKVLPNTNIGSVSGWLTTILVGVGIAQFDEIGEALGRLFAVLGPSFSGSDESPTGRIFAGGLVVYGLIAGFLVGYIFTVRFLPLILDQTWVNDGKSLSGQGTSSQATAKAAQEKQST